MYLSTRRAFQIITLSRSHASPRLQLTMREGAYNYELLCEVDPHHHHGDGDSDAEEADDEDAVATMKPNGSSAMILAVLHACGIESRFRPSHVPVGLDYIRGGKDSHISKKARAVLEFEQAILAVHHAPEWLMPKLPKNPSRMAKVREGTGTDNAGQDPILLHVRFQFGMRGILIMASTGGGGQVVELLQWNRLRGHCAAEGSTTQEMDMLYLFVLRVSGYVPKCSTLRVMLIGLR
jgi:hypothetical protein